MKRLSQSIIFIFVFVLAINAYASAPIFSTLTPKQGETVVITLSSDPKPIKATYDAQELPLFAYEDGYRVLVPIAFATKVGAHKVVITYQDQTAAERVLTVRAGVFPVIELPVPEKLNLTPQQLTQSLGTSNTKINKDLEVKTPEIYFSSGFGLPLYDNRKIGSIYGETRKTGSEVTHHYGVDFTAKVGTPVAAINSGVVQKAYLDSIYGNSVIIDHGQGITTLYLHLNSMSVKAGQKVKKGELIGTVGQTGYASGPHLHLSLKVNGISVDPLKFVNAFK
jgi:murein DD-endopeptidase MepM/ murein hydrolase activator NlpD